MLAAVAACAMPQTTFAQFLPNTTVTLDYLGYMAPAWTISFHQSSNAITATSGSPFKFTYDHTTPAGLGANYIYTFCIEPVAPLPTPPAGVTFAVKNLADYTFAANSNPNVQTLLRRLYGHVFGGDYTTYNPGALTTIQRAALQFAIWEIAYDSNNDLDRVGLQTSGFWLDASQNASFATDISNARILAEGFLTTISSVSYSGPTMQLVVLQSDSQQDQIYVIPEPATWAAIFAGASLLVVVIARRRRGV